MTIDYTRLRSEITTDPLTLGYAARVSLGNDQGIAALLNATTGSGAAEITLTSMTNEVFVTAFLPYLPNVAALSDASKKDMYWNIWQAILSMPIIKFTSSNVTGMLTQAVADAILSQVEATALMQRVGSRAEVLFGQDTVITVNDVSLALRGI